MASFSLRLQIKAFISPLSLTPYPVKADHDQEYQAKTYDQENVKVLLMKLGLAHVHKNANNPRD
jgi:hypothetical protein